VRGETHCDVQGNRDLIFAACKEKELTNNKGICRDPKERGEDILKRVWMRGVIKIIKKKGGAEKGGKK